MKNKFEEGQEVRIVPIKELVRLKIGDGIDIVPPMFKYGGYKAKITTVIPQEQWTCEDIPEYELDADNRWWIWYENLLEPIE